MAEPKPIDYWLSTTDFDKIENCTTCILIKREIYTVAARAEPGDLGLKSHPKVYQQKFVCQCWKKTITGVNTEHDIRVAIVFGTGQHKLVSFTPENCFKHGTSG